MAKFTKEEFINGLKEMTILEVNKILKEITGLGLVDAKALADNGGNVKENVPAEEANNIKAQLEEAGAEVELA